MYIIEYEEYKKNYEDLITMGDLREYMIQEFVIRLFLQKVLPELDIIPTHTKINDKSSIHNYEKYCGIGKSGKTITPDLCVSKNWRWDNGGFVDYRAVVEVKSPVGYKFSDYVIAVNTTGKNDRMRKISIEKISDIKNAEIREELFAHTQVNEKKTLNKVIFTDGLAWLFIEGNEVKKRYDIGTRKLRKFINSKGKTEYEFLGIEWLPNYSEKVDDLVIRQIFDGPITNEKSPREFNKLIGEIKYFCENNEE